MAVQLSQPEFQRLVRILQSQADFANPSDRQMMMIMAFGNDGKAEVIHGRLNMSGARMAAAVEVINFLSKFGQVSAGVEALGILLTYLVSIMGGGEDADYLTEIISKHKLNNPPATPTTPTAVTASTPAINDAEKYIFISYARPDQTTADQVEDYLKAAGFRIFRDIRDIGPGDNWDLTIEKGLREATHMVLLLSASSMPDRKEVHREWFPFDQENKPIVPLYIQDCTLHTRMKAYNYIDARSDMGTALARMLAALK